MAKAKTPLYLRLYKLVLRAPKRGRSLAEYARLLYGETSTQAAERVRWLLRYGTARGLYHRGPDGALYVAEVM